MYIEDGERGDLPPHLGGKFKRVSDYQGWTNWETWNTALMMDNERETNEMARQLVEQGASLEQFRDWLIQTIIGPENKRAIEDAKEWNSIPEEERLDYNYEDFKNKHGDDPQAMDLLHGLAGGPDVSDSEPTIIDPELVNWDEIYQHIQDEFAENDNWEQSQQQARDMGLGWATNGGDNHDKMRDAIYRYHGAIPEEEMPGAKWDDPRAYYNRNHTLTPEEFIQTNPDWDNYIHHESRIPLWSLMRERHPDLPNSERDKMYDWNDPEIRQILEADPNYQNIMQNGYTQRLHDYVSDLTHAITHGNDHPHIPLMQQALAARGYTPEEIAQIMQPRWRWNPNTQEWIDLTKNYDAAPPINKTLDQPGTLTFPETWSKVAANTQALFRCPQCGKMEWTQLQGYRRDPQGQMQFTPQPICHYKPMQFVQGERRASESWKQKYHYRAADPDAKRTCNTCSAFIGGKCHMFYQSNVEPEMVCSEWSSVWKPKTAMAFSPQQWEQLVRRGDPFYHVTHREFLPAIMAQGLSPASERDGHRDDEGAFWQPRPGHVYLYTDRNQALESSRWEDEGFNSERMNDPVLLQIDISQLDPQLFAADEDYAYNYEGDFAKDYGYGEVPREAQPEWYEVDPVNKPGRVDLRYPEQQSLGEWAHEQGLNSPQVTDDSALQHLSVAYGGTIPPSAITVDQFRFSKTADAGLDVSSDNWWGPQSVNKFEVDVPGEAPGMGDPSRLPGSENTLIKNPCFCDVGPTTPHEWTGACENGKRPIMQHEAMGLRQDYPGGYRERWQPGDRAFFEYHCNQAHDSEHAQWWYRSHQPVTVIGMMHESEVPDDAGTWTFMDRSEEGAPHIYRVRWDDGAEGDVFEDELLTSARHRDPTGYFAPPPDWQQRIGPITDPTGLNKQGHVRIARTTMYHVSPSENRTQILQHGLHANSQYYIPSNDPRRRVSPDNYVHDVNFVMDTPQMAEAFGNRYKWTYSPSGQMDVWAVDVSGLPLQADYIEYAFGPTRPYFVPVDIPPERLHLLYTYKVNPSDWGEAPPVEGWQGWRNQLGLPEGQGEIPQGGNWTPYQPSIYRSDAEWVTAKTAADNVPGMPQADAGEWHNMPIHDNGFEHGYLDHPDNWVWLDGKVGWGGEHHEIARNLAQELGYDQLATNNLSNLIARNALPDQHAVAIGTLRGGYPQIYFSTRDRNAIWDDVARSNQEKMQKVAAGQVLYHVAPQRVRDSIMQHGLDPARGVTTTHPDTYGYVHGATYLHPDLESALHYAELGQGMSDPMNEGVDVWSVNPEGLQIEPGMETDYVSRSPIPASSLTLSHAFPGVVAVKQFRGTPLNRWDQAWLAKNAKVALGSVLYHGTRREYRDRILQEGLEPRSQSQDLAMPNPGQPVVFLGTTPEEAREWAGPDGDVWQVDVTGLPLEVDQNSYNINGEDDNYYTTVPISPDRLKLVNATSDDADPYPSNYTPLSPMGGKSDMMAPISKVAGRTDDPNFDPTWPMAWEELSPRAQAVVAENAHKIWNYLENVNPNWGPLNCNAACTLWKRAFRNAGIDAQIVGGNYNPGYDPNIDHPGLSDHVWLMVDGKLFDPTAAQFSGSWSLDHYYPQEEPEEETFRPEWPGAEYRWPKNSNQEKMQKVAADTRYYHSTNAVLYPGDIVVPGAERGVQNFADAQHYDPTSVYLWTKDVGVDDPTQWGEHTYEVDPLGPVHPDPEGAYANEDDAYMYSGSFVTPRARVIRELGPHDWGGVYSDDADPYPSNYAPLSPMGGKGDMMAPISKVTNMTRYRVVEDDGSLVASCFSPEEAQVYVDQREATGQRDIDGNLLYPLRVEAVEGQDNRW